MWQQVQQFRKFGKGFAMQHKDSEYLDEVEAELRTAVLEAIPPEERLRGLLPEERLRGLPPNQRMRGVSFDELVLDLSEDQVVQLREALERRSGS
jgi:hypothetical protein